MKNIFSLILFISAFNTNVFAQNPLVKQWDKRLGGTSNDELHSLQQTTDGGYILGGHSQSGMSGDKTQPSWGNSFDYWIVKIDSLGLKQWDKRFGGTDDDLLTSLQQTSDGGYIIAGNSNSIDGDVTGNHGFSDYWVAKLDDSANMVWQKALGGSIIEYAAYFQPTSDGGYVFIGHSHSDNGDVSGNHGEFDYWVVKVDSLANILWQRSLGGSAWEFGEYIQQTNDGGFIVAGSSNSNDGDVSGNHGQYDIWVVKLDNSGYIEWQKSYGGSGTDRVGCIRQTFDGGYIFAGNSVSNDGDVSGNHGYEDYWIVKLDNTGNIEWQKCLGGSDLDVAESVLQTPNGGFIVAGYTDSEDGNVSGNHGYYDYWVVKLDPAGTIQCQKCLGGEGYDWAHSLLQTSQGELVIAGYSASKVGDVTGNYGQNDYWLVKLSCDVSQFFYADLDNDGYGDSDVVLAGPACVPPAGYVYDSTDCDDSNALVFPGAIEIQDNGIDDDCNGIIDEIATGTFSINDLNTRLSIFPNPNDGRFTIYLELNSDDNDLVTIEVINLLGQIVYDKTSALFNGKLLEEINLNDRSSGMYLIKVFINDRVYWGPLISKIK